MGSANTPPRWTLPAQALLGALLIAGLVLRVSHDRWNLPVLGLLLAIAVISDLLSVASDSRLKIAGASLAFALAAVQLGSAPAALIGAATILIGWLRWREAAHYLRNNLIAFAAFPFLTGLTFHAAANALHLSPRQPEFYALVAAVYFESIALNVVLVIGYQCLVDGRSFWNEGPRFAKLVATSELLCAVLVAGIAWLSLTVGIVALGMVGVALIGYQHVIAQLIVSRERGEKLRRQAITDELTGLPNRVELIARTERALSAAGRTGQRTAILLLDLNNFKQVNDVLGHPIGDRLLEGVAHRLGEAVGESGELARLSGDEFALLVERYRDDEGLLEIARTIIAALERPFDLGELSLEIGASIGIAQAPIDGNDVHTLLKRADVAMYAAKEGSADVEFYRREDDHHTARRLTLTSDLRAGIARGEVFVEYQPEVLVGSEELSAVEALARWEHPSLGRIAPVEFIVLAEQTGLIRLLTEHILDLALEQLARSRAAGLEHRLAVNLSARLLSDRRLPAQIISQLANAGIDPQLLSLEITETMVLRDPARAATTLRELHAGGVGLSIDDFGTGYSSMAYLRELPLDELKVDRSFVSRMEADQTDAVIVRSVIELGHSLQMRTVAEGVEDMGTLQRLRALGCDIAQGYHISRPLPAHELLGWALEQRRLAERRLLVPSPPALRVVGRS